MAAAVISFAISGQLLSPPDEGAAPVAIGFSLNGQANSEVGGRLTLVGSGTKVVPFGTVGSPGAKAIFVEYLPLAGGLPVHITFNGGTEFVELTPGGFLVVGNPAPVTGITALSIVFTADCQLRVKLLG